MEGFEIKRINCRERYLSENIMPIDTKLTEKSIEKIQSFLDELQGKLDTKNLSELEKLILALNYIQSIGQYVSGEITYANKKQYKTDYEDGTNDLGNMNTFLENNYGNCAAISDAFGCIANYMNVKVEKICIGDHAYNVVEYENKVYIIDPTWSISRNRKQIDGCPKPTEFTDEFFMIGINDISETGHHLLPNFNVEDCFAREKLDRNIVSKAIEKLRQNGIKFEYDGKKAIECIEIKEKNDCGR